MKLKERLSFLVDWSKHIVLPGFSGMNLYDVARFFIEGLEKEKIKGYLTDVLAIEPIDENDKLRGIENIIITPHVGSRTYQAIALS